MYNLQFRSQNLFLKEWFNFAALHFEGNLSIFIDKLMILARWIVVSLRNIEGKILKQLLEQCLKEIWQKSD